MSRIDEFLNGVRTVAIAGHVNPDGDCVGSCMATYLYLRDNFPEIEADFPEEFLPALRRCGSAAPELLGDGFHGDYGEFGIGF